ncbi:MAG: hypothetical protein KatS3mg111_2891 [Pirellulaceae bacterium]|nr:MAG: hypothetical protein KatS3mg111_2891 [Pirellulaceae bacterium]
MRKKIWIDGPVQGVLVGRVVVYWVAGMLYLGLGLFFSEFFSEVERPAGERVAAFFSHFLLWIPSLVLLLPLVIFDVVRLSHLFAGPIYRLRLHLKALAQDLHCKPLRFRDDDCWQDLALPVNEVHKRMLLLNERVKELEAQLLVEKLKKAADLTSSTENAAEVAPQKEGAVAVGNQRPPVAATRTKASGPQEATRSTDHLTPPRPISEEKQEDQEPPPGGEEADRQRENAEPHQTVEPVGVTS